MRALSVKQPWAELIASGRKRLELRTWSTRYRGPLLICASAQTARSDAATHWLELHDTLPLGVATCIVELVDVRQARSQDSSDACCAPDPRELAWVLANPIRVAPRVIKGRLGLFEVSL